jgi:hypothetical protein
MARFACASPAALPVLRPAPRAAALFERHATRGDRSGGAGSRGPRPRDPPSGTCLPSGLPCSFRSVANRLVSSLPDPRQDLRCCVDASITGLGHPPQAHCRGLTLAEWVRGATDRHLQPGGTIEATSFFDTGDLRRTLVSMPSVLPTLRSPVSDRKLGCPTKSRRLSLQSSRPRVPAGIARILHRSWIGLLCSSAREQQMLRPFRGIHQNASFKIGYRRGLEGQNFSEPWWVDRQVYAHAFMEGTTRRKFGVKESLLESMRRANAKRRR